MMRFDIGDVIQMPCSQSKASPNVVPTGASSATDPNLQTGRVVLLESCNSLGAISQQVLDDRGRLIAAAQPDHLRGRPQQRSHLGKIGI